MLLTALSTSSPAKEIYNQSDGSIIYSQTLTFQETLTANSSTNNGDISGIGADVDGSDKGDDDLETGSVNTCTPNIADTSCQYELREYQIECLQLGCRCYGQGRG